MKQKIKKYAKELIFFFLLLAVITNILSYYRSLELNKESLKINTFTLLDDSKYIIKENKPIIIHFWATWCPTCKFEAANIEKISKDYEVITIAVQSGNKKDIENYLKKNNLSFNVVNDDKGFYSNMFNIEAFPTTFIYDKNKKLRFSEVGYTSTLGLYSRMIYIQ